DLSFFYVFGALYYPTNDSGNLVPEAIAPIIEVIPLVNADLTGSPSSTTVEQDAPFTSNSTTPTETQPSIIPQDVGDDNLDMEVAHMGSDLLFSIPIPEVNSEQSTTPGNNLYTLSIQDMMASSPICLMSKTSKTKSWLWHRRLSHLNFGAINHLARQGLVRGLPKLKFKKDHLCLVCAMGKITRKTHKPKSKDTNQEKLYLLHMDLCRPMCVESLNGNVDDYSRFTWVKFLRSKDETLDFIIKFLKMIQKAFRIYNRRTRRIVEIIHVDFDELTTMASEQRSSGPALNEMTPGTISLGLVPTTSPSTSYVPPSRNNWDLLFQPMFDELLNPSPSVVNQTPEAIAPIAEVIPL
nr:retrovirus-related Pol polyprotein from transposon TNT 1-94 [Tanacetum cinerariifolium]